MRTSTVGQSSPQNKTLAYENLRPLPPSPSSITPPIFPPSPPPLLPQIAIELLLPQLLIDRIMRLTHPMAKLRATRETRLVAPTRLPHPIPEILGADPARVQAGEESQERAHLGLLLGRGGRRVGSGQGVEKCPCRSAEGFHVGRTTFWDGGALLGGWS